MVKLLSERSVSYSVALFLSVILLYACESSVKEKKKVNTKELKVMVWNIFHGGYDKDLPKDGRLDVINIIKDSKADLVLMIETYGSAPMIAKSLGFYYELLSDNLCVFSRYPISKKLLFTQQISSFNFGGVEINVHGQPIVFFDTWLHYLPDERLAPLHKTEEEIILWEKSGSRDEELEAILKVIKPYIDNSKNTPIIMGGDFNSHSHLDWINKSKDLYNHGGKTVKWPISVMMEEAGFTDTYRIRNPFPEKNIGTTWLSNVEKNNSNALFSRRDRIDYIYKIGKKLKVKASENGVAPFSKYYNYKGVDYPYFPSDHGFVLTTFRIKF